MELQQSSLSRYRRFKANNNNIYKCVLLLLMMTGCSLWHQNMLIQVQAYAQLDAESIQNDLPEKEQHLTKGVVKKQLGEYHQQQQQQQQQQQEPIPTPVSTKPIVANDNNKQDRSHERESSNVLSENVNNLKEEQKAHLKSASNQTNEPIVKQETNSRPDRMEENLYQRNDEDISKSLRTGFYFFLALSTAAIFVILYKVFRLRLSRAERKYGVQGDRSTQELTPLPMAIDEGHSDEDDQTLFDIQRQQLRIF